MTQTQTQVKDTLGDHTTLHKTITQTQDKYTLIRQTITLHQTMTETQTQVKDTLRDPITLHHTITQTQTQIKDTHV